MGRVRKTLLAGAVVLVITVFLVSIVSVNLIYASKVDALSRELAIYETRRKELDERQISLKLSTQTLLNQLALEQEEMKVRLIQQEILRQAKQQAANQSANSNTSSPILTLPDPQSTVGIDQTISQQLDQLKQLAVQSAPARRRVTSAS